MQKRVVVLVAAWLGIVGAVALSYADVRPAKQSDARDAAARSVGVVIGGSFMTLTLDHLGGAHPATREPTRRPGSAATRARPRIRSSRSTRTTPVTKSGRRLDLVAPSSSAPSTTGPKPHLVADAIASVLVARELVLREAVPANAPPVAPAGSAKPTDLNGGAVYIDGRVRAAHDGYLPPSGERAAHWRHHPYVPIEMLDASGLGLLFEQFYDHIDVASEPISSPSHSESPSRTKAAPHPGHAQIRECDSEGKTETKSDDCST